MKVKVKFVGSLKEATGEGERVITLRKGTVQELREIIFRLYPEQKKKIERAGVFIGGVIMKHTKMHSQTLKEGDELSLILPVAGG